MPDPREIPALLATALLAVLTLPDLQQDPRAMTSYEEGYAAALDVVADVIKRTLEK